MQTRIATSIALKAGGAAIGLLYVWVLSTRLPPAAFGQLMAGLALSHFGGGLMAAGWVQLIIRDGARARSQRAIARLVYRSLCRALPLGLGWVLVLLVISEVRLLPSLGSPVQVMVIAFSGFAWTTVLICAAGLRAGGRIALALGFQSVVSSALPLLFVTTLLGAGSGPFSYLIIHGLAIGAVALVLMAGLGVLVWRRWPRITPDPPVLGLWRGQFAGFVFPQLDIVAAALVLAPAEAGLYLTLRRIAGIVDLGFDGLRTVFGPDVSRGFGRGDPQGAALGVNRWFLRLGAVSGTLAVGLSLIMIPHLGFDPGRALAVQVGLIVSHAIPALFGATGLIMMMGGREELRFRLTLALGLPTLPLLILAAQSGALWLSLAVMGTTATLSAASALMLWWRAGVVPPIGRWRRGAI